MCPKVPDAFDFDNIFKDIKSTLPNATKDTATDLIRFWLAGSGLENISPLTEYNRTYMDMLNNWYGIWSKGYDHKAFFDLMQTKYGYSCDDLFNHCELAGKVKDCCSDLFFRQAVMRRGICYQTRSFVNQVNAINKNKAQYILLDGK